MTFLVVLELLVVLEMVLPLEGLEAQAMRVLDFVWLELELLEAYFEARPLNFLHLFLPCYDKFRLVNKCFHFDTLLS